MNLGHFSGFKVGDFVQFELLQFADDAVVLCDGKWANLWSFKAILRGFQLAYGLHLNLNKSGLFGVNINVDFIQAASSFLACKVVSIPFLFLGTLLGVNHRRRDTWNPIISKVCLRLLVWHIKSLTLGNRVTMLDAVLANNLIYFLSFFKAPKVVVQKLISIQRRFLWGGVDVVE